MPLIGPDQVEGEWSIAPLLAAAEANISLLSSEPLTKFYLGVLFIGWIVAYQFLYRVYKVDYNESKELAYDIFSFIGLFFMGTVGTLLWTGMYGNLVALDNRYCSY